MVNITELEAAFEVFRNKQGKILTTDLPLVSSSLGISLSDNESEMVIKDAMGKSVHVDLIYILRSSE